MNEYIYRFLSEVIPLYMGFVAALWYMLGIRIAKRQHEKILDKYLQNAKEVKIEELEKVMAIIGKVKKTENMPTQATATKLYNRDYNIYNVAAEDEKKQCAYYRGAFICAILLFIGLCISLETFKLSEVTWVSFFNRAIVVLPFLLAILFFAKEAMEHRRSFLINRQKFMDMAVLEYYCKDLEKKEKIKVINSLNKHFFNHKEFDYKNKRDTLSKDIVDILKATKEVCCADKDMIKVVKSQVEKD